MNLKNLCLVVLFLFPFAVFGQSGETIKTKGVIKNIEKKRSGRSTKEIALVGFVTQKGDSIETYVDLTRFPIVGSLKSIGDKITVNYDAENPAIARTDADNFLSKYGMYILIALGIALSLKTFLKAKKDAYKQS